MSVTCFANSASDLTEMNYEGITVTFSEGSNYTNDEKKIIADRLVYGYTEEEKKSSTYAWCWLTGHNLTNESEFFYFFPCCLHQMFIIQSTGSSFTMRTCIRTGKPRMDTFFFLRKSFMALSMTCFAVYQRS